MTKFIAGLTVTIDSIAYVVGVAVSPITPKGDQREYICRPGEKEGSDSVFLSTKLYIQYMRRTLGERYPCDPVIGLPTSVEGILNNVGYTVGEFNQEIQ